MNKVKKTIIRTHCLAQGANAGFFAKILNTFGIKMNYSDIVNKFNKQTKQIEKDIRVGIKIIIKNKDVKFYIMSPYTIDLIRKKVMVDHKITRKLNKQDITDIISIKKKKI